MSRKWPSSCRRLELEERSDKHRDEHAFAFMRAFMRAVHAAADIAPVDEKIIIAPQVIRRIAGGGGKWKR